MLTYKQAAVQLGVHVDTVRGWARSRQLEVVRLGHKTVRIKEASLERVIEKRTRAVR